MPNRMHAISGLLAAAALALGATDGAHAGEARAWMQFAQNSTDDLPAAPKPGTLGNTKPPATSSDAKPPMSVKPPGTKQGYMFKMGEDPDPNQWPVQDGDLLFKPKRHPGLSHPSGPKSDDARPASRPR